MQNYICSASQRGLKTLAESGRRPSKLAPRYGESYGNSVVSRYGGGVAIALLVQKSIDKNISEVKQPSIEQIFCKPTNRIYISQEIKQLVIPSQETLAENLLCGLPPLGIVYCA